MTNLIIALAVAFVLGLVIGIFIGSGSGYREAKRELKEDQDEYEIHAMDEKYRCRCGHLVREHAMHDPGYCLAQNCPCMAYGYADKGDRCHCGRSAHDPGSCLVLNCPREA
jgi:hypothetical protein